MTLLYPRKVLHRQYNDTNRKKAQQGFVLLSKPPRTQLLTVKSAFSPLFFTLNKRTKVELFQFFYVGLEYSTLGWIVSQIVFCCCSGIKNGIAWFAVCTTHTGSSRFSKLCSYLDTQTSLILKNLTWLIFIYMYNIITISLYNISIITRGRKSEHPREDSCSWNKTPGCLRLHNHTGPLRTGLYIKLHNYNIQRFSSQQKAIKYCFWDTLTATS